MKIRKLIQVVTLSRSIQLKSGKYAMFTIDWDSISGSKNIDGPWVLRCSLPGIKEYLGNFGSAEEAKIKAERVFTIWFHNAELDLEG